MAEELLQTILEKTTKLQAGLKFVFEETQKSLTAIQDKQKETDAKFSLVRSYCEIVNTTNTVKESRPVIGLRTLGPFDVSFVLIKTGK